MLEKNSFEKREKEKKKKKKKSETKVSVSVLKQDQNTQNRVKKHDGFNWTTQNLFKFSVD